jgi:hypothetical protein
MKSFINWNTINEATKRKKNAMPSSAGLNTPLADINEILVGYYALGGKWKGFVFGAEAKRQLKSRQTKVGEEKYSIQSARAKVMAEESLKWAKANGYKGKVKKAWWTARPGEISKAVEYPVDWKKNPTDTLLLFSNGQFLGLSAKSTKGKGDIGFKNPGIGTIDKALGIKLKDIDIKAQTKFTKLHGLSEVQSKRKIEIRKKKSLVDESNIARNKELKSLRLALFKKLSSMTNKELREYILSDWMDVGDEGPAYIKVTGHGNKPPFTASILNPLKNSKSLSVQTKKIKLEKVGNDSIGILAGGMRICKMRAKFESQAMASPIKFSGDPWK